ncbi:MAG: iron ABC transporter substrate-binding protein [Alsobacter sp.]
MSRHPDEPLAAESPLRPRFAKAWRRAVLALVAGLPTILAGPSSARTVTDSAGRQVEIPDSVGRVFAAGPPASTLLAVLAPETMVGWVRAPRAEEKAYLPAPIRDLPETGRLTGRGDTVNLEALVASKPDLILDFGTISDTYASLADRVQSQTGIPYLLVDGRFANTPAALRLVGGILGKSDRAEALAAEAERSFAEVDRVLAAVPAEARPRVYLARGPEGLESGSRGSINTEIIERAGAMNVVEGLRDKGGLVTVSPEQVLAWAPDTVITLDARFARAAPTLAAWKDVPAVAQGRIYAAPSLPFGFIDSPPSVNRIIGLRWLLHVLYPGKAHGSLRDEVAGFYKLFYRLDLTRAELDTLLAASGPASP